MNKLVVVTAALALVAGCKKKEDSKANTPPPAPASGSGSGSGSGMAGSGSAAMAAPGPDPKLVERGAYIAKMGACLICHTAMGPQGPDRANVGGGGLEMKEAGGIWRSANITPDKGTGIGNWTDDQILAAIREGVRPDGAKLIPIMPYMNYNVLTDDDGKALVAFLRSLKPVERTVAKSEVKMESPPAPRPPNQAPGDDVAKKGAYYASIMLCSHCHWTPNKEGTAPAGMDKMFSGGLAMEFPPLGTGILYSRNITSDAETGIGKWTEDQIFTAIKMMQKADGKMIMGPMLLMQSQWSQVDDGDLKAVASFIKKLPAVKNKVPEHTFVPHPAGGPGGPGGVPGGGSGDGAATRGAGAGSAATGSAAAEGHGKKN